MTLMRPMRQGETRQRPRSDAVIAIPRPPRATSRMRHRYREVGVPIVGAISEYGPPRVKGSARSRVASTGGGCRSLAPGGVTQRDPMPLGKP